MLKPQIDQINQVEALTSVLENVASLEISRIREQVLATKQFFGQLWQMYAQLRRDPDDRFSHGLNQSANKAAILIVTSEAGLSGDLDQRLIDEMRKVYRPGQIDLFVIGSHGAVSLAHLGIPVKRVFQLADQGFNPGPVLAALKRYNRVTAYYQTYTSLTRQDVVKIDLIQAVSSQGAGQSQGSDLISSRDYLFEPSLAEIANFMESIMLEIALSQIYFESKLAQAASRFAAMNRGRQKSKELSEKLGLELLHAKRAEGDERLKETINGMQAR